MSNVQLLVELAKVGLFAAVGGLIDFLMHRSEKDRLREYLGTLVLRFDLVTWNTLGRDEANAAIRCLDYLFGKRLLSWDRLLAAVLIASFCESVTGGPLLWAVDIGLGHLIEGKPLGPIGLAVRTVIHSFLVLIVMIALSLSLTRWLSSWAAASQSNGPLVYALLLIVNVTMFVLWQPFASMFYMMAGGWNFLGDIYTILFKAGLGGWYAFIIAAMQDWPHTLFRLKSPQDWASALVNGTRIAFALAFALSIWSRALIREPLLRLGYGIADTKKPIFTLVFTGIGVIVVFVGVLRAG